jgi:hypothetical protein
MNNKILLLLLFTILLASFVIAPCPPDCSDEEYAQMELDQFKEVFKDNPLLAVEKAPELYVELLKDDPMVAATHPGAYEKAIYSDITVLNENKEAFIEYVRPQGIIFSAIDGEFKSFDSSSGMFVTTYSDKEVVSFSLNELNYLNFQKEVSQFEITKEGVLKAITESGDTIMIAGKLENSELRDGFFSFNGDRIEINGNNHAKMLGKCVFGRSNCGVIELFADKLIVLPNGGVLMRGSMIIEEMNKDYSKLMLSDGGKYINPKGYVFDTEKELRIVEMSSRYQPNDYTCGNSNNCVISYEKSKDGETVSRLIVIASDSNKLRISGKDGTYDDIAVREIELPNTIGIRRLGNFENTELFLNYLTGRIEYRNPNSLFSTSDVDDDLLRKLMSLDEFKSVLEEVKNQLEEEKSKIILELMKDDQKVEIIFDGSAPKIRGDISGMKTDLINVFAGHSDGSVVKFPWLMYDGELSLNFQGEVGNSFEEAYSQLLKDRKIDEALLLVNNDLSRINQGFKTLLKIIIENYPLDEGLHKSLFDGYEGRFEEGSGVFGALSVYKQAQEKGLEKLQELIYLRLIDDSNLGNNVKGLRNPGEFLKNTLSDEIKRKIIEETTLILKYPAQNYQMTSYLFNYLNALKNENTELQKLALEKINFEEGIFKEQGVEGSVYRWVLEAFHHKPEVLKYALDQMPKREDISFDPDLFKDVYFSDIFESETKDFDFPNKYSVALSVQRFLEGINREITPQDIEIVTQLIVEERKNIRDKIFLGEGTYYIPIAHDEPGFDLNWQVAMARRFGVKDIAATDMKGAVHKERFLQFVKNSRDKGPTTIHFNNHGGLYSQSLSAPAGSFETSQNRDATVVSAREFGDALLDRGDLGDVNIIIDSCFSTDFKNVLYTYLISQGVEELPTIVAVTNRGSFGYRGVFESAVDKISNSELTGADFLDTVEKETFNYQDLSITVPKNGIPLEISSVDSDEGEAKSAEREEQEEEHSKPTFIEIANNLQETNPELAEMLFG